MESAALPDAGPTTPAHIPSATATPTATPAPALTTLSPTPALAPTPLPDPSLPPPPVAPRRAGLLVTLVLGCLSALPPLSLDTYLPALPQVTDALHSPAATVQLTLTACLAGLAFGQLVVGPLSDRFGRRRPLLIGMVVYVLATAACAFAPSVELLIGFRLLQGLAGAAGIVISRAVVRDLYDGVEMARFFSTLMLISGMAPIVAPLVGGQILRLTDWRGVFAALTAVGILLTLVVWRWLHETLPPERRQAGGLAGTFAAVRRLLADRPFTGYVLTGSLAFAALFAYVSASSFVVQDIYGASPQTFSLLFGLNSIGIVGAGQLNGKVLVGRVDMSKVLGTGLVLIALAAAALVVLTSGVFGKAGLPAITAALFVLMAAMGLTLPNTSALALMRTRNDAGSAAALIGTAAFLGGALATPLAGIAGEGTAVPMAVTQLACALLALCAFVGLCVRGRRTVEAP